MQAYFSYKIHSRNERGGGNSEINRTSGPYRKESSCCDEKECGWGGGMNPKRKEKVKVIRGKSVNRKKRKD